MKREKIIGACHYFPYIFATLILLCILFVYFIVSFPNRQNMSPNDVASIVTSPTETNVHSSLDKGGHTERNIEDNFSVENSVDDSKEAAGGGVETDVQRLKEYIESPCVVNNPKRWYKNEDIIKRRQALYQLGLIDSDEAKKYVLSILTIPGATYIVQAWLQDATIDQETFSLLVMDVIRFAGHSLIDSNDREGTKYIQSEYAKIQEDIRADAVHSSDLVGFENVLMEENPKFFAYAGTITELMAWQDIINSYGVKKIQSVDKNSEEFLGIMFDAYSRYDLFRAD